MFPKTITVEPVLKDHPFAHKNVASQDWWSLATGSVVLKCWSFCQKCVVFQDRWSLMAVVSQDRFHCSKLRFISRLKIFPEIFPHYYNMFHN